MSLQGTLDTFGLQDVLALLSSTKKKGELKITGPGFTGSVWMDEGKLVGAEVPRCPTLVDAVFELLRLADGAFAFDADSPPRSPMTAQSVGDVLSDAEERLIEWRDIAIVVPSVHSALHLATASPASQIVLDPDQWRLVVASSLGASLADLADALDMGEFQICRTAKYLVENGLATVEAISAPVPPVVAPAPVPPAPAPIPQPDSPPVVQAPAAQPPVATPPPAVQSRPAAAAAQPAQAPVPSPPATKPAAPAAVPAVEQPAAVEQPVVVDEEDKAKPGEPVDRSALLKFLSSVRN